MSSVPRVTSPRHYIWGHIASLSHIAFSQTQYLVTHVHILWGAVISQILYLGLNICYLQRTPFIRYLRSQLQNIQDYIPNKILNLV